MTSKSCSTLNQDFQLPRELKKVIQRIADVTKILGVIVVNAEGITVKSTLDNSLSSQYSVLVSQLSKRAKSVVKDMDPTNELTYLRIRSRMHEVLVAPEAHFILIVVQTPSDSQSEDDI